MRFSKLYKSESRSRFFYQKTIYILFFLEKKFFQKKKISQIKIFLKKKIVF